MKIALLATSPKQLHLLNVHSYSYGISREKEKKPTNNGRTMVQAPTSAGVT